MSSRATAWLFLLCLTSCAGPQIRTAAVRPLEPAESWRTDSVVGAPPDADWWREFGDPRLTAIVERALDGSTDIAIAVARLREAGALVDLSQSALLPTLEAGASGGRSRSVSAFGRPLMQSATAPTVQVAYEVDLFGRLSDQRNASRATYLASKAARDATRLAVAATATRAYLTLLGLDMRLAVARETVQARDETLKVVRSRATQGYAPMLELEQADADYQSAAQLVPQIKLAITRAEDALSVIAGDLPSAISRNGSLDGVTVPRLPTILPSELMRRRPDVAQAELTLTASDANLAAARKRFLPQLRLNGSGGVALSTLLANPISIWSIGGSVLAPLFEGGRLTAQANVAGAQRDQAVFAYRRTALSAFRDVEDALAGVARSDEQEASARRQVDALREGYRLASNRYREGFSPFLEQLDAQRGLLAGQLQLIQIRSDALNARVQLFEALGGGWTAEEVRPGSPARQLSRP